MCTAITFNPMDYYFGRNLDFEHGFGEKIVITPRNFPFKFRREGLLESGFALIGTAVTDGGFPLYFDAINEKGLGMAGLNFPDCAVYLKEKPHFKNVAPFEFIPFVLGRCATLEETRKLLKEINLVDISYSADYPQSPLHFIIADKSGALTVEPTAFGLKIYENPIGVLTNSPPFDFHLYNLNNYLNLTSDEPENRFAPTLSLLPYSRGMGSIGLPGDLSSASRFIRAAFTKINSVCDKDELSAVNQFFHILYSVAQTRGCVKVLDAYEKTIYSCCFNLDKGIYYFTRYENFEIYSVSLFNENLNSRELICFDFCGKGQFKNLN